MGDLTGGWKNAKMPTGYLWFKNEISNPPKAWIHKIGR